MLRCISGLAGTRAGALLIVVALVLTPLIGRFSNGVVEAAGPLAAPELSRPVDGDGTRDTTPRFTWRSVRGADGYVIELAHDATFVDLIARGETDRGRFTPEQQLPPGVVFWRVNAFTASGEYSEWSTVRSLVIEGTVAETPAPTAPAAPATEEPAPQVTATEAATEEPTAEQEPTVQPTQEEGERLAEVEAASFAESGGQVWLEAEAFDQRVARSNRSWVVRTDKGGFRGSGFVRAEPDGGTVLSSGFTTTSPELKFSVSFSATGTYYVWVRGMATGGGDDSAHVGLDGAAVSTADRIQWNTKGAWVWTRTTLDGPVATINVKTVGTHTVNVWMREDGLRIDSLLLTTSSTFVPSDSVAAPESSLSTPVPTATTSSTISRLMLVNADNAQDLWPMTNDSVIDLTALPTSKLSVRADVAAPTGSVVFAINGKTIRTENAAPFTLAGDSGGSYTAYPFTAGTHTLTVTPFTLSNGGGTAGAPVSVRFTVVASTATPTPTPTPTPNISDSTATVACSATGVLRRISVSTSTQLSSALTNARAGDLITLADGTYTGKFKATADGTASNPITVCGSRNAIVRQADLSGTTVFFDAAAYWTLDGFTLRNGVFAVRIERSRNITMRNLDLGNTGQSGILVRYNSTDTVLERSWIHDTGISNGEYGEGIYIGQNYTTWLGGTPDRTDRTQVLYNSFGPNVRAEAVDVKEGASNGVVRGNQFDGTGMTSAVSYVDSWVDIKGNGWLVAGNRGAVIPIYGDGYEVTGSISGWGRNNRFEGNYGDVRVRSGGDGRFGVHVPVDLRSAGNVVTCDNEFVNVDNYSAPICSS